MAFTPRRRNRYPALNEAANVPQDMLELATDLDNHAVHLYGTLTDRAAVSLTESDGKTPRRGVFYHAESATGQQLFVSAVVPPATTASWVEVPLDPGVMIGVSLEYEGSVDPPDTRFLLENHRLLSQAAYPALYALIGDKYKLVGDPAGDFRLAPAQGRVVVAADPGGAVLPNSPRTLGAIGGEERHIQTPQEAALRNHRHHFDLLANNNPSAVANASKGLHYQTDFQVTYDDFTSGIDGGEQNGTPMNNMQPYLVKNKIIRVR